MNPDDLSSFAGMIYSPRRFKPQKARHKASFFSRSLLVLACSLALGSSLHAQSAIPAGNVCFYEHINYGGASFCVNGSMAMVSDGWNDQASSVRMTSGLRLEMFEHRDFNGAVLTTVGDAPNLVTLNFNDRVSSFRLTTTSSKPPPQPTTFTVGGIAFNINPCATENGRCTFTGSRSVAYGAQNTFSVKTLTDGTDCNNRIFGDPLAGIFKACYLQVGLATPPLPSTPPPIPTPNPTPPPPSPQPCVGSSTTPLTWNAGTATCQSLPVLTYSGSAVVLTDSILPTTGSASFLCTNGNWGAPVNPTCNAAPVPPVANALTTNQAARFLTQASFGPTTESVTGLTGRRAEDWLTQQMTMPAAADYVDEMQRWFDLGSSYRPGSGGTNYSPGVLQHKYWSLAVNAPDQLRRRVVHALLQIHVLSMEDSNLYDHGRTVAQYVDNLGKHAFGNYRNLLQDVALSPAMGIYLSHIRNQKENTVTGRLPDENFAREIMQLFSIGLNQLNIDGTVRTDSNGKPLETYTNDDVIGMARVFTGWSWDMPDGTNASNTFQWGGPGRYETVGAARFDLKPMRVYPSFHEAGAKSFLGVTIPAGTDGNTSLRIALDTLFNHPNVGPFIGKQLIQRMVTSNPSPAYVTAVAQAFNNNGSGVRGDMAAVIRAVLLHPEARSAPAGQFGKLREPVLRITQAARALQASSSTNRWMMGWEERNKLMQSPLTSPSVFNFYRPGYVPPNTQIATMGMVAPEFQIANETTVVEWVNYTWALLNWGVGWTGSTADVTIDFNRSSNALRQAALTSDTAVVDQLDMLLFAGNMSATLRRQILNAMQNQVGWNTATRLVDRQKVAAFIALTSSEYLIER